MKLLCLLVPILSLSILEKGVVEAKKPSFLLPPASSATKALTNVQSIPRGGGTPLDAYLNDKFMVCAYGANAILCNVAPSLGDKAYGLNADPASERLVQTVGSIGSVHSLLLYLQLYQGMSFDKALGWSVWPWILTSLYHALVAKNDHLLGYPTKNHIVPLILNALVFVASQTQASWAGNLNKFYGFFSLLYGIPTLLFPQSSAKFQEVSLKTNQQEYAFRSIGYFLVAHGISVWIGADGGSLSKSIGWSAVSLAVSLIGLMVLGPMDAAGIPKAPVAVWALLMAFVANSQLGFV